LQHNLNINYKDVFNEIVEEKKTVGYYELPLQDTSRIKLFARSVNKNNIVVIGIGGSTLGTYAIYKFLKRSHDLNKKLFFLETTDPVDIEEKLENIELQDTLFIVISKSGTTIETITLFKYINSLLPCNSSNTVIVSESDSKLTIYGKSNNMQCFEIPKNIGGRFSVFSVVGLLPLAIVGIDIDLLLKGARQIYDDFFEIKNSKIREKLLRKAKFFVNYKETHNINVIFSYSSQLDGFNKWYVQLWGESLGKIDDKSLKQGLTPIAITGPIDQHSFLQLIMEGKRDKTVTFIKINSFKNKLKIPNIKLKGLEEFDGLYDITFSDLINKQADATIESVNNTNDIPYDVIIIDSMSESAIAALMYEYELLTSIAGRLLNINTYNQPGVEMGKCILKSKLKKGFNI